jgi:Na+-translocating ferredoxin:NAD+ oxidoreductase RnfE subunit
LDIVPQLEETKRHRFSALVDGICIGVGVVFMLLGVLMPVTSEGMLVQGLLSIIGGLVVTAVGTVVEVYHWAKLR